jgi:hypothetical protein
MFLYHLKGLLKLLLAWILVCGAIWPVPDSFANPRDLSPPSLKSPFEEDEEFMMP